MRRITDATAASTKPERLIWMDIIRGSAILMVILYHTESQISSNLAGVPNVLPLLNDAVGPFRMPVLMMLSGVLLPVSLARPGSVYIKGKLAKIGWPYLLWSVAFLALLAATSGVTGKPFDFTDFGRIIYDPLSHLWYLAYLLIFYVVCLLIPASWHMYLIPASIVGAIFVEDNSWEKMLILFAFFLLGETLARYWETTAAISSNPVFIIGCVVVTLGVCALAALHEVDGYEPLLAPLIACGLFAAMPVAKWLVLTSTGNFLAVIGKHSIVFYVSHFIILILSFNILARLGVDNAVLLSVLLPATCLAGGLGLILARSTGVGQLLFELPTRKIRMRRGRRSIRLGS